jgi:hypothetical protein
MFRIMGEKSGHVEVLEEAHSEDAAEEIAFQYRMTLPGWVIWIEET